MIRASGIVFLDDNKVLLLKRSAIGDHEGQWAFPGGKVEDGETVAQAAVRECQEEMGYLVTSDLRQVSVHKSPELEYTTFLTRCPAFIPVLNDEHTDFDWVDLEQFAQARQDDADFNESDHPRANDGKFTSGGGGGSSKAPLKETKKDPEGKRVQSNGSPLPEHVAKLKLPPAWNDVRYNDDPHGDLLATGKDSKGRMQSVYSAAFSQTQAAAKFARINELGQKFQAVSAQNAELRKSNVAKVKDSADCLELIMQMGVRPGSDDDTGAKVKAYGATTLEGKHVVQTEQGVSLRFVGKKGVSLDLPVTDPALASMLLERAKGAGADGKLFPATNDKALLDHVHGLDGGGFKTKDFRTHVGTSSAFKLVQEMPAPKNEVEYKKAVMAVAKQVSTKLGNTPVIALQSYISPTVFAEWRAAL